MMVTTLNAADVEKMVQPLYFRFEEDFVRDSIRCIPMIVRFKLDATGIKLKLGQWSKFSGMERNSLATLTCDSPEETDAYRSYLKKLILLRTGQEATLLPIDENPAWADMDYILPEMLEQVAQLGRMLYPEQWQALSVLQRFALVKLCRPGHENRNFPIALKEFGL